MTSHESGQDSITPGPGRARMVTTTRRGMDASSYFELLNRAEEADQNDKLGFKDGLSMEQVIQKVRASQEASPKKRKATRNKE